MLPIFTHHIQGALLSFRTHTLGLLLQGFHLLRQVFPDHFRSSLCIKCPNAHIFTCITAGNSVCSVRFSLALLAESHLLSFPPVTKIFQFAGCTFLSEQFGNLWLKGCMLLPTAFRSLPRPSSLLKPRHPLNGLHYTPNTLHVSHAINAIHTISNFTWKRKKLSENFTSLESTYFFWSFLS